MSAPVAETKSDAISARIEHGAQWVVRHWQQVLLALGALVNDLDLTVTGPGGTYLGNVFAEGVSQTGGEADRRNNVEQVLIATPEPGASAGKNASTAISPWRRADSIGPR